MWPWHVAIFTISKTNFQQEYRCGGVLLNDKTVITTAVCVKNKDVLYTVKLGISRLDMGVPVKVETLEKTKKIL